MLVYNAFTIPYRVCFGDVLSASHGLWYLDRFIDVFFIIDVVANFHTGYVRSTDGQVELSRKLVRWNYLKTWFAIDFISSVPYEVIVMIVVDSEDPRQYSDSPQLLRTTKALKISRYIRFLKVVKVLRLVRAVHIFKRFEKVSDDYCNLKSAHPLRFGDANYAAPGTTYFPFDASARKYFTNLLLFKTTNHDLNLGTLIRLSLCDTVPPLLSNFLASLSI